MIKYIENDWWSFYIQSVVSVTMFMNLYNSLISKGEEKKKRKH